MAIQQALEKAGLTVNEAKTYLALIDLGTSLAGKIAQKANLHRRPTYDALHRLIAKGLVSYTIIAGRRHFKPVNPVKLIELARERKREIETFLPEIAEKFKKSESKVHAEIYEGADGIKTILDDIIKTEKEWAVIGGSGKGPIILPYYADRFQMLRIKTKIPLKAIMNGDAIGLKRGNELSRYALTKIRYLSKQHKSLVTVYVYGQKSAIVMYSKELPFAVLINDTFVSNGFREVFNWLWRISRSRP